jgi:hypothetical protein
MRCISRIRFTKIWCGLLASRSNLVEVSKQTNDAMREGAVIATEVVSVANVQDELVTLPSLCLLKCDVACESIKIRARFEADQRCDA